MQEHGRLVPDVGMVSQTEQTLLKGKHDALGDQTLVLHAQGIASLPADVFLPQVNLENKKGRKI